MFVLKFFSFFFVCILAICGNLDSQTKNAEQPQPKEKKNLSLRMERSGCYGRCPIYSLDLKATGKVTFDGKFWTKITGKVEDNLTEEQLNQLIIEIEKAEFFSLKNNYNNSPNCPSMATDSPSVTLTIQINERSKTIEHYLGCNEKALPKQDDAGNVSVEKDWTESIFPQQLYKLENKIDEIVETKRWIGEQK